MGRPGRTGGRGRAQSHESDEERTPRGAAAGAAAGADDRDGTNGEVRTAGLGALKLETFSGSRNPTVFRDWRKSVDAVQLLSGLPTAKLAVYAWMSLRDEAKDVCRHLSLQELNDDEGLKLLMTCLEQRYERQAYESYEHWQRR